MVEDVKECIFVAVMRLVSDIAEAITRGDGQ
jgi:hypothetical protein